MQVCNTARASFLEKIGKSVLMTGMEASEMRKKFLAFFELRGHTIVPSSSLIPSDPSVLLTTAGMQQFKSYLTGQADPIQDFGNRNVFSIQKSFRTTDIDEVGDNSHLTFFEMLGNFSFGGYFKERAIPLSFEFITSQDGLNLDPHKLFITAFKGDDEVPRDDEAIELWKQQFEKAGIGTEIGERIFLYGREKNWWEAGSGPAGPDAEMFYDRGTPHDPKFGSVCHPNCDCGRFVEIGNDVFVQYNKTKEGKYEPLRQKAIDNGRGFERLVMVAQGKKSVFETDLFAPVMSSIVPILGDKPIEKVRLIADHIRASVFLIGDGIDPSNEGRGYILRRLIRRAMVAHYKYIGAGLDTKFYLAPAKEVVRIYSLEKQYSNLRENEDRILNIIGVETEKFGRTLDRGLQEFKKTIGPLFIAWEGEKEKKVKDKLIPAHIVFRLYDTYGFPVEVTREIARTEYSADIDEEGFKKRVEQHRKISRAGVEKKFGGHGLLLDTGELKAGSEEELKIVTRLHTATHLLNAALRKVLGEGVEQRGSDITAERTRFDFQYSRKLTNEELKKVEELVNYAIKKDFPITIEEMPLDEAKRSGALFFYKGHYPERVKVYTVGDSKETFSKELCGGPHVSRTGEIEELTVVKEEASSAGVRRIRAKIS